MNTSLRIAIAGHVDHGKSTVLGRLLRDTGTVHEDRFLRLKRACESEGRRFEFAFLLDALEEEQEQGITIDVTEVRCRLQGRDYTFIDTPGHKEFLKNMVGGASRAEAAILVVDVTEGIKPHFRNQASVMNLLGIPRIVVVLNKMDLSNWAESVFFRREEEIQALFRSLNMPAPLVIPLAAALGAGILEPAPEMPWYRGPCLARALADLPPPEPLDERPLRFALQDVYKFDERRIYAGRVDAGILRVGDRIRFFPSDRETRVKSIEAFGESTPRLSAYPGDSIGITLEDPLYLKRGEVAVPRGHMCRVSRMITADLFWLSPEPLTVGRAFRLQCAHSDAVATVERIESVTDSASMNTIEGGAIQEGNTGRVCLRLSAPVAHDLFIENESTGRIVLAENFRISGGGRIVADGARDLIREPSAVTSVERERRFGHPGFVVWMTGLSGAGKSTLARRLERELFDLGRKVCVLDGDNLRLGLCSDLGFSAEDRSENIRRIAETATLMSESGLIVIVAAISPFAADRANARRIVGESRFLEIFVDCPLEECERRDSKRLYQRARLGQISNFTGIQSVYEPPTRADLRIPTHELNIDRSVEAILATLERMNSVSK